GKKWSLGWSGYWADTTRGDKHQWILDTLMDTSRSPAWMAQNERTAYWKGEVDYFGPCNVNRDSDCDHWFNSHDNCPNTFNLDQAEGTGGWGVACPGGERPPPTQTPSCSAATVTCGDQVSFSCAPIDYALRLDELGSNG